LSLAGITGPLSKGAGFKAVGLTPPQIQHRCTRLRALLAVCLIVVIPIPRSDITETVSFALT